MLKQAVPLIFVHCHALILPSGSLDALPSRETLPVGKVTGVSGPAIATGGLLLAAQPSQESSRFAR